MYLESLGLDIDPEVLAMVEAIARREKCSAEEIIVRAIGEFVSKQSQ